MHCEVCLQIGTKEYPLRYVGKEMIRVHSDCLSRAIRIARAHKALSVKTQAELEAERLAECPQMIRTGEASYMLNVHPNTLRRWADAGRIEVCRVGARGDRRYLLTHIESLVAEAKPKKERMS